MRQISFHQFRQDLTAAVGQVIEEHAPLRVTRDDGEDFVVVSAADWDQEQETLYALQNQSLLEQIQRSLGRGK